MHPSVQKKLISAAIGAAVVGALGVVGGIVLPAIITASMASEPTIASAIGAAPPVGGSALSDHLAKFAQYQVNGQYFELATTPDVSLTPEQTTVVRKIAFGQTTFVNIVTSSTGTYSSDALASGHVRYPGIYTARLEQRYLPATGDLYGWSHMTGWVKIAAQSADSVSFLDTEEMPLSQQGVCVKDTATGACRQAGTPVRRS